MEGKGSGIQRKQVNISKKKMTIPVCPGLRAYLTVHSREIDLPVQYEDLTRFQDGIPVYDKYGNDTLWVAATYPSSEVNHIHEGLKQMYSILKTEGDSRVHKHLHIKSIDFCTFGNSNPFRIKIVNNLNDNYDYFYIKKADASRIYGLELEHILSPQRINYFVDDKTLLEEHIAGIPGDIFIEKFVNTPEYNKVRIAKELVKFNERCFVQLLGDMRSYNYVFDLTPDFEEVQFRIRAIDFDQQCYEGHINIYRPQFFKENYPLVKLVQEYLTMDNIEQYQKEERTLIARRSKSAHIRLNAILSVMERDFVSLPEKVDQLKEELAEYYDNEDFLLAESMGNLVRRSILTTHT